MSSPYRSLYEEIVPLDSNDAPGGVMVYYADGDEEIIHVNQYILDLFECDGIDEFLDHVHGSFRGFVHSEDIEAAEASIWGQVAVRDNYDHVFYRIVTKSGRTASVEDFGRLVTYRESRPMFHVFIIEMQEKGEVDWLTGLPSKARFLGLAGLGAASLREKGERPVAVALDLVSFKAFNAKYGRDEGDRLLRAFADLTRKCFGSESCSRFEEDQFYAFASEADVEERLGALFERFEAITQGKPLPVRAGVYACNPEDDIVAIGFDRAQTACDLNRMISKSQLTWFSDVMRADADLRIHVLDHLTQAIENGWIRPFYQAIVRSSTSLLCGEEALARWIDPQYGTLLPNLFVPLLEDAGLLEELDLHMVDCVIADLKKKQDEGVPIVPVSVNISLRDLGQIDIAKEIARRADAAGVPHNLLRVEFSESVVLKDTALFKSQVKALHEAGFAVWLDDFGSGYASLNTLQEYEFDLIKLDMGFMKNLQASDKARTILAGIVQVATKMGVDTLAEGVEDEKQALYLESIGCNMLQGYYFTKPLPVDMIIERAKNGTGMVRERVDEFEYWNKVSAVDLIDPASSVEGRAVDGTPLSEFPAGIMERRGDIWNVVRANRSFREFLDRGGAVPLSMSNLEVNIIERGADEEFVIAAEKSKETGTWERVAGRMEYGTGLQVYTRPVAASDYAECFVLTSVPTMLGTALGTYGDVPVAYAVLRAIIDEGSGQTVDAVYMFANSVYCEWTQFSQGDIAGRSFIEMTGEEARMWIPSFHRAALLGETVHDVFYTQKMGHWLSFNVAPSPIENCCVFAFTLADDERREREEIIVGRDTSDLIIRITDLFNSEVDYETAMLKVLETVSQTIHPKRLYILQRDSRATNRTFEWCAEGVRPIANTIDGFDKIAFRTWEHLLVDNGTTIIPDVSALPEADADIRERLLSRGITHALGVPLYNGSELVGFIVADNYELEQGLDIKRLLETIASFVSARIVNEGLVNELEAAGTHDGLTGVLNRRGIDEAITEYLSKYPDSPYALALMDVDDFKTLNDKYGHEIGDVALRSLARVISDACGSDAIVGRNGGDEFLGMLTGEQARRADEVFEKLSNTNLDFEHDGNRYHTSLSIGYVSCPDQVDDLKDAYVKADAAVYAVKLTGKSGVKRYSSDFESEYRTLLGFSSRDLAENIPGGIMVHKATGGREILFANDEIMHMLECDNLSEFMAFTGGAFDGLALPEDLPHVKAELERQVQADVVEQKGFSDYRVRTKTGKVRHVAANSRLVDTKDVGKVFYVIFADRGIVEE